MTDKVNKVILKAVLTQYKYTIANHKQKLYVFCITLHNFLAPYCFHHQLGKSTLVLSLFNNRQGNQPISYVQL